MPDPVWIVVRTMINRPTFSGLARALTEAIEALERLAREHGDGTVIVVYEEHPHLPAHGEVVAN